MFLVGRWALLANGALCLSTPKHNGKSDTDRDRIVYEIFIRLFEL
jgi:hypothetical protein